MPTNSLKTEQDCRDFLTGLKLMGTGGGGSAVTGMELLTAALQEGLELSWIDAADLPDEAYSCTVFGSGSIAEGHPEDEAGIEKLAQELGIPNRYGFRAPEAAVRELATYSGVKIGALVAVELGAGNTAAPLVTAARLGIPLVDGDYSGRAVPQEMQTTYFLMDKSITPAAVVDWWGDVILIKEGASAAMIERIGKMLAVASYGVVYFASVLLSAPETRQTVVPGTLTLSFDLGKAIHQALASGKDPIAAAVSHLNGWHFFSGVVSDKDWQDKEGVMVGTIHLQGTGSYRGQNMQVWFLNENHVSWLNGTPYVCSPDLILLANPHTGEGYTNTEIKSGDEVAVLGCQVHPAFRSQKGVAHFGPRYWGFDFDYTPIEQVLGAAQ